jgi:hypothetical protein
MTVKVVNNLAGSDEIILILLVFEAYLKMIEGSAPSLSII